MYLKRLEIQGFKTFAQKTVLEFVPDANGRYGMTAVVGPNGSGKSNVADAIRWVMGEQSMKLLRGKKGEDVIFSGSEKRARSGFAEVTMTLENNDKQDIQMNEVVITRRLYRDGTSEYEVNKQSARLQDVVLLLAQCGIGQRTYSVIGQGMIDAVLVASPSERKEFFDEAFGLRPFQLKRQASVLKIQASKEHARQTDILLQEIGPRLSALERQAKRLEQRASLEEELHMLERAYYGHEWMTLHRAIKSASGRREIASADRAKHEAQAKALEQTLAELEKATPPSQGFREIRAELDTLAKQRAGLREEQMKLETKRAVAEAKQEKPWAPLPLSRIIGAIDELRIAHEELDTLLAKEKPDVQALRAIAVRLKQGSVDLLGKLQRPAPEPEALTVTRDPEVERGIADIAKKMADIATKVAETEARLESWNANEEIKRSSIFETQHLLNKRREEVQMADRTVGDIAIELTRLETRRESLLAELMQYAPHLESQLDADHMSEQVVKDLPADAPARIHKLRSQLEWIGGIDPEVVKEYQDTKVRFETLSTQHVDLVAGIASLERVVEELDTTIRERSERAFHELDKEFGAFFKTLFNGGEAKLVEMNPEPEVDEEGVALPMEDEDRVVGIDILATPPGKRLKSISLLSGGERALTSIALICAIMATNPSPFVVLDEVDAALDESNSKKFAQIVASLAQKTQFVVVTHNRSTMSEAHVLYGITMGEDGVSQLLSVKLEDVEKLRIKS